jgi:hypothetical protein
MVSRKLWVVAALTAAVAAAAGGWLLWGSPPDPEPEAEAAAGDSGMSDERTEELMRSIGYVQQ